MPARPATVVLVDDDREFRLIARELFSRRGYAVLGEAACAAAVHALVERLAPDLVVMDVHLGDENGFDVTSALTSAYPGLAVVLMSADGDVGEPHLVRASGARAFFAKSHLASADLSLLL